MDRTGLAVLGIDLGTSSVKAAVFDASGGLLSSSVRPYGIRVDSSGMAEQDPRDWVRASIDAVRDALDGAGNVRVRAIGLTGQWSGTVPVDSNTEPLGNAIIWMDTRGARAVRRLAGGFPSLGGYRVDKLVRWIRITGGAPAMSGKDSLAHVLYLKEEEPDRYREAWKFLEPKDFLAARLTGSVKASWDNIALMWCTDNRNPGNVMYDKGLVRLAGLQMDKLPEIVSPADAVGGLSREMAGELGLGEGLPVISGGGDMQCSLIGSGCTQEGEALLYLGTSSWITSHVKRKKTDVAHNIASLPAALPGLYFLAAEQENAGSCLEFACDLLGLKGDYGRVHEAVAASGESGAIFLPWLMGERAPVEEPWLRGGIFNVSLSTGKGEVIRSVMEGVALNSRWLLGPVDAFLGTRSEPLRMAGGCALSPDWPQIYADVTGRRVQVVRDPREATVRGAAMLAAMSTGLADMDAVRRCCLPYREFRPSGKDYSERYEVFLELYRKLRREMRRMNSRQV